MIKFCIFAENNNPLLDDYILKSWGNKTRIILNRKSFKKTSAFSFMPQTFTLIALKHNLQRGYWVSSKKLFATRDSLPDMKVLFVVFDSHGGSIMP